MIILLSVLCVLPCRSFSYNFHEFPFLWNSGCIVIFVGKQHLFSLLFSFYLRSALCIIFALHQTSKIFNIFREFLTLVRSKELGKIPTESGVHCWKRFATFPIFINFLIFWDKRGAKECKIWIKPTLKFLWNANNDE